MIQKLLICKILAKRNIMIKKICLVFIFILLSNISNASKKIDLQKQIQSFSWNKRIVLFITKGKYIHFINEVDDFFKKYKCENEIRNLEFIKIVGDEVNDYIFPDKYKNKYGIWLIGYDGGDKSYSLDTSLFAVIILSILISFSINIPEFNHFF